MEGLSSRRNCLAFFMRQTLIYEVSVTPDANHLRGQYDSSVIFFESKTLSTKGFLTEYSREMLGIDKKMGSNGFKTKIRLIKIQTDIFLNLGYKS